jgi:hypothetical protein
VFDFLKRLLGTVGGAVNNVGRFVQQNNPVNTFQQVQRQLPQAQREVNRQVQSWLPRVQPPRYTPPPQLQQIQNLNIPRLANISADTAKNVLSNIGRGTQQQFNRTALAQTPKLAPIAIKNIQNVGGKALSGAYNTFFPVTNQVLNTYKDLGNRGAAVSAQLTAPIYKPFLNSQQQARYSQGVGNLYRKADSYQKVGLDPQAKIAGGDFGEFAKTLAIKGTGAGLEIAPVVTGMPGGAKLSTKLLRGGSLGAGANTAYSALTGQYTNKTPAELAQQFAIDVAGGYGGELLGHGLGKVGRGGQTLAKEAKALDSAERASNGGFVGGFAKLPEKGKKEIVNISKAQEDMAARLGLTKEQVASVKGAIKKGTTPPLTLESKYAAKMPNNLPELPNNVSPTPLQSAKKVFGEITDRYLGSTEAGKTRATTEAFKLKAVSKLTPEQQLEAILHVDSGTNSQNPLVQKAVNAFRDFTDKEYERFTKEKGIKMGYIQEYLPRIYRNPSGGENLSAAEYKALTRSSGRTVQRTADELNKDALAYQNLPELAQAYTSGLEKAAAGRKYLDELKKEGLIIESGSRPQGMQAVNAPGFPEPRTFRDPMTNTNIQGQYYADPTVAAQLNKMFGADVRGAGGKALKLSANIASKAQDIGLAGGIPGTPLNALVSHRIFDTS